MKKTAVWDTNIFLHYDIISVDWCKELDASEVEIIVCQTVLRELDDKKADERKVLAQRAKDRLHLIDSFEGKAEEIRKNVKITVLEAEPKVDWDSLHLDPTIKDDRIIASIVERGKVDVLVTDDTTPRIKARKMGIKCVQLEAYPLPEPRSDLEIELANAKRELQEYKNRTPKLSLFLYSEEQEENKPPKFSIKKPKLMTQAEIDRIIAEKGNQYYKNTGSSQDYLDQHRSPDMQAYMDRMNFLTSYRNYLDKKNEIERLRCAVIPINFDICSEGTVPAEDVGCYLEFPEGFEIIEEINLQERLKQPEEPTIKPSNLSSIFGERVHLLGSMNLQSEGSRAVSIDIDGNTIYVKAKRIKHGYVIPIEDHFARLHESESAKSFEIKYELDASNLRSPIKGKIPVLLEG
jgi:PIN domain